MTIVNRAFYILRVICFARLQYILIILRKMKLKKVVEGSVRYSLLEKECVKLKRNLSEIKCNV